MAPSFLKPTVLICEVPEEPQTDPYPSGQAFISEALDNPQPELIEELPASEPQPLRTIPFVALSAQQQSSVTPSIMDDLIRTYWSEGRTYSKPTMVTHKGTVIAFAMDQERQIYYAVLDANAQDESNFLDKNFWPDELKPLQFPNEIEQVGFGDLGTTAMPTVKKESGREFSYPLTKDQLDPFLSTTARLSAAFPFQIYSDNKFLYMFRQAVGANNDGNVFKLQSGASTGDSTLSSSSYVLDSAGEKVSVVNSTLLCDCFLLAGTSLLPVREARFRRSRSRTKPASNKDSMGASDMNGNPFYIPTKELTFISNMRQGSFDVLQLPTAIGSLKRWQILALNETSNLLESFNIEVGDDGFFNLAGTQLYTSPDTRYKDAVLERSPGECPFTKKPLVPIPSDIEHAESSFSPGSSGAFARAQLTSGWSTTEFTIELWCKAQQSTYTRSSEGGGLFRSNPANYWGNLRIVHERSSFKVKGYNWSLQVGSAQTEWQHIAVSYDGSTLRVYLNGSEAGSRNMTETITFNEFTVGRSFYSITNFYGEIDELRVWNVCRSGDAIQEQRNFRLIGYEPGLEAYYRFDEGGGSKVFDHSPKARHATITGTPDWVASTCPLSDNGGVFKNVFSLAGSGGTALSLENISANLFFQQELATLSVGQVEKPLKRQARVLLVISTSSSSNSGLACLDLGVSRHGRLPRMPDSLTLPVISKPTGTADAQRVASLEATIRSLRSDIIAKKEEHYRETRSLDHTRRWFPERTDDIESLTKSSEVLYNELRVLKSNLETEENNLAVESQGVLAPIRLGMSVIHSDSAGLSIHGALLSFANCNGYPRIHVSGTGLNSILYNDGSGKMYAAYLDTNVERTRFNLPEFPELSFVARSAGARYGSATLEITNGTSSETCRLTFRDTNLNITETWLELPRNSAVLADVFNGVITRPAGVQVTVSPKKFSVEKRSSQLIAIASGVSRNVTNKQATRISGKDPAWVADAPGRTLSFNPNDAHGYLQLPESKLPEADPGRKVTAEAWVYPQRGDSWVDVARLINMDNERSAFALRLKRTTITAWKVVAEASCGKRGAYSNRRAVKSKEEISAEEWTHLALMYEQRYALLFQRKSDYVDCGNNEMLNIKEELTLEIFLQLESLTETRGILGKGSIGDGRNGTPYQVQVNTSGKIQFLFQNEGGELEEFTSSESIQINQFYRIAISRTSVSEQRRREGTGSTEYVDEDGSKKTITYDTVKSVEIDDFYEVSFYINGELKGTSRSKKSHVVGNNESLYIGRSRSAGGQHSMRGKIAEVRIWNKSIKKDRIGSREVISNDGLVCWWTMEDTGPVIEDRRSNIKGRLRGVISRVISPDRLASQIKIFKNGLAMDVDNVPSTDNLLTSTSARSDGKQFTLASHFCVEKQASEPFQGMLEEVRIWKTLRTKEQLLDNLFTRLKGEMKDLVAYYTFDEDLTSTSSSTTTNTQQLLDQSLRANHLEVANPFNFDDVVQAESMLSTAPISNETAVVRSALHGIDTQFHSTCDTDSGLSACEYADLQRDHLGNLFGVLKRCYAYIKSGTLVFITGYKVGAVVTEWMGQAQFDPQVIGFVEGAPPVPSENLTAGVLENANNIGVVTVNESESVSYSIGASKEGSVDMGFMGKFSNAAGSDDLLITAPLGFGIAKKLTEIDINWNLQGNFNVNQGWSQEENQGYGTNNISSLTVATGGGFEDKEESGQLNPVVGRRTLISNMGFALVQSSTADIFALRLEHNNALVSYRMVPNRDIPPDWNILTFPINPRYTKQGTLDGKVGFDSRGIVVPDPDYGDVAKGYGEFSYFKPKEAYALERHIRRTEQRNLAYYQDFGTGFGSSMGAVGGLAAGAAASMLIPVIGPVLAAASLAGGLAVVGKTINDNKLDEETFAKRDIVNTYVWTADGGFYEESTGTSQIRNEVSTGNFGFTGGISGGFSADVEIFSFGLNFEFDASLGGGMSVTKTKAKDTERNFDIEVECSVPGDLNKYTYNEFGIPVGVYDDQGNPVSAPGKVDAYRFKTFYLDASPSNFEDLFGKVVDPIWLSNSQHANAVALRQANQAEKKPPCWRVFHRVTFVSRILPDFSDPTEAPLESAMKTANIASNWVLFQTLDPFVKDKTGDDASFGDAVRKAVREYLPELVPQMDAIIEFMRGAYDLVY